MHRLTALLCQALLCVCLAAVAWGKPDIVGVWRCDLTVMSVPAVMETVYHADGTFDGMVRSQTGFMSRHWGRYFVGENFIRFEYEGHEPREYCGPHRDCHDLQLPEAETMYFRIVSPDVMEVRPAVCMTPPCGCLARRGR